MSLILMDGFDHYSANQSYDKNVITIENAVMTTTNGRFGSGGFRCGGGNYSFKVGMGVNKSTIYLGIAANKSEGDQPVFSSSYPILLFYDESGISQVSVYVNPNFSIGVYRGTTTLLGTSSADAYPNLKWFYLEAKVTISATVGEVTIRVNETQVLNLTSQNTKNGSDYIRSIKFAGIHNALDVYYDDLYVDDAQFHGDCRIRTFVPDSISSINNDFTASAGNKDECVDETPSNEDTDYIYSDTLNHKQTFGITTGSLGTVIGIQLNNHVRIDQAGTRKITPLIRSNSTNYSGTETDEITAEYLFESKIWETDPDDSNAWTQTKLEAAEFGLQITT